MSRTIVRIFGVLLLLALIVAGGAFVYRAGVAQGISQAPEVAEAIQQAAENGEQIPPTMFDRGFGYGSPYHHRGFGHPLGFGLFHIFGFFFIFLFFFFGLLRLIFFRGWSHHNKHGHWGKHWEDGAPPMFDEWHKKAHGEESAEVNK